MKTNLLEDANEMDERIIILQKRTNAYNKRQMAGLDQRNELISRIMSIKKHPMALPELLPGFELVFKEALAGVAERLEDLRYMKLTNILINLFNKRLASQRANLPSNEYTSPIV